jgi:hypothetical protein
MWRRQNSDSGQDLVEYAIVFPVLMPMLLGIFDFGPALKPVCYVALHVRYEARPKNTS